MRALICSRCMPGSKKSPLRESRDGNVLPKLNNGFRFPLSRMVGYSLSKMLKTAYEFPAPMVLCWVGGQQFNLGFLRKSPEKCAVAARLRSQQFLCQRFMATT